MQAPIYLFLRDQIQRAAVMRDLAPLNVPVRTFESGADLALATRGERPALVLWDLDESRPRGGMKRLAARLGSAVIGLTFERERLENERDAVTLLLPYARWRVAPIAQRMLRAGEVHVPSEEKTSEDEDSIFSPRLFADTKRQAPPDFRIDHIGYVADIDAGPTPDTAASSEIPALPPGLAVMQRRVRVLIASEDKVLQHILRYQLESMSCEVLQTGDGVDVLRAVQSDAPDVLLLDLDLPFLNGFEILEQLAGNDGPRPRVIMMSEQMHDDKVVRAFDLGADDFVHRPLNPRVIASRIMRLVKGE